MFSPFKWWQNWTESWHWYVAVGSAHQSAKTYHNTTLSSHGYSATRQMNVCLLETQICRFETIKSVEYRCKILVPLDIDGKTLFLVKTGLLGDSTGILASKCHRYWSEDMQVSMPSLLWYWAPQSIGRDMYGVVKIEILSSTLPYSVKYY